MHRQPRPRAPPGSSMSTAGSSGDSGGISIRGGRTGGVPPAGGRIGVEPVEEPIEIKIPGVAADPSVFGVLVAQQQAVPSARRAGVGGDLPTGGFVGSVVGQPQPAAVVADRLPAELVTDRVVRVEIHRERLLGLDDPDELGAPRHVSLLRLDGFPVQDQPVEPVEVGPDLAEEQVGVLGGRVGRVGEMEGTEPGHPRCRARWPGAVRKACPAYASPVRP